MDILLLLVIGLCAGGLSGLLGIGGGIVMVPMLVLLAGFAQKQAQGTSIAVMIPPVGLAAAIMYYRAGYVDVKQVIIIAIGFVAGSLLTAGLIEKIPADVLKRLFGLLLAFASGQMLFGPGDKSLGESILWVGGAALAMATGAWLPSRVASRNKKAAAAPEKPETDPAPKAD